MYKSIRVFISLAMLSFMATSCDRNPSLADDKKAAEEQNDAKFNDKASEKDAKYIVDAYSAGLVEINMSKRAVDRASNAEVKNMAQMMVEAHTNMNAEVAALATKKNISLPSEITESQMKDINSMADKSGNDFDKAYIDKLVSDHKDAVSLFEEASQNATDNDIRDLFAKGLPTVQSHLDKAKNIQDQLK